MSAIYLSGLLYTDSFTTINKVTQKYLEQHSLAIDLSKWPQGMSWDYVLIVPVCGEVADFLTQLMQHQRHCKVLIVVLVNRPQNHPKSVQWQTENEALLSHLSEHASEKIDLGAGHQLLGAGGNQHSEHDVLLLNFNKTAFDESKGVGLARRIAADTALALIAQQVINTAWIFSTDADVKLPQKYFEVVADLPVSIAALSLGFVHQSDDSLKQSLQGLYDFKLRYYQLGVRFIGADYDYIPLGSTLVVEALSYAKVRGFPCRSGGEDFYILNKLAKLGEVYQPAKPVIEIRSRFSDRVPFGTGPAISKIHQQQCVGQAITFYHPNIFHILKRWFTAIQTYYQQQQMPQEDFGLNEYWQIEAVLQQACQQAKSEQRWQQFIHEWFDAFKILKSVHYLGNEFKSIPHDDLLTAEAFQSIHPKIIDDFLT